MKRWAWSVLWLAAMAAACGLDRAGEAEPGSDSGAGTGGTGIDPDSGWGASAGSGGSVSGGAAGSASGGASGSAGAPSGGVAGALATGGAAGSGGITNTGGAAGGGGITNTGGAAGAGGIVNTGGVGGGCGALGASCSKDAECCDSRCGPAGADPKDCNTNSKCASCRYDYQCASNERCDDCACKLKEAPGTSCDEPEDCKSSMCGPAGVDAKDCDVAGKCAQCRYDYQCSSGERCDGCLCKTKEVLGTSCDEDEDCKSNICGRMTGSTNDCNVNAKCVACRYNYQCTSGRCEDCTCLPRAVKGEPCNEPSDCTSNVCGNGGKCT